MTFFYSNFIGSIMAQPCLNNWTSELAPSPCKWPVWFSKFWCILLLYSSRWMEICSDHG